jgi:hypothetical protein
LAGSLRQPSDPYIPTWERLAAALGRVRAETGLSEQEAQSDICAAIGDGTIRVRLAPELIKMTIEDHRFHHDHAREIALLTRNVYDGINSYPEPWEMHRPFPQPWKGLKPSDLNWHLSKYNRPFQSQVRPDIAPPMLWDVSFELFSDDVTKSLIAARREVETNSPDLSAKRATKPQIREAIAQAYRTAESSGSKPPNIKELPRKVQLILESEGILAAANRIQRLGEDEQFRLLRRKPGKTVASEKRSFQK